MRPLLAAVGLLALACGGAQEPLAEPRASAPSLSRPATQRSDQLGVFGAGTVGPYLGPTREGWLAVWVEPRAEGAAWVARPVDREGRVLGAPLVLGSASPQTHLLKLVGLGDELLVLFTDRRVDRVGVFSASASGQVVATTQLAGRAARDVVWLDAIPTSSGALVLWAERKADNAVLFAARREPTGALGEVSRVHAGARAWQVAPSAGGALLAVVTAGGEVELVDVDPNGQLRGTRSVAESQGANPDIDMAAHGDGLLLVFSRREAERDVIVSERLDADGEAIAPPVRVSDSQHSERVVRLIAAKAQPLLVWRGDKSAAGLHAGWLDSAGRIAGEALGVFSADPEREPEFAANSSGVAVLLPQCAAAGCENQPGVQWFEPPAGERVDSSLRIQSWPSSDAERIVWGLSCEAKACAGMSAEVRDPIAVSVRVSTPALARDAQSEPLAQPAFEPASAAPAQVSLASTEQLTVTPPLADLAGITRAAGTLLTWVTQFDPSAAAPARPAPDGRSAPLEALLQTQWTPAGSKLPEPEVISYRARSLSGVALAAKGERALLAWSALDGKSPQVFTTLLDATGKRLRQAVQTTKQGEVFELDVAPLESGWALAWVDDRSGRPLSYVSQVSDKLKRLSRDLQLPTLHGEARAVIARRVGGEAWLLVVDAADAQNALALQRFEAKELQPLGPSVALVSGQEPLSSPDLLVQQERVWLLWISGGGATAKAWAQPFDLRGEAESPAIRLAPHSQPVTLGGTCHGFTGCGYWLSEAASSGHGRLTASQVLGGVIGAGPSLPVRLWTGAEVTPVPLVRGEGSELWLSVAGGGVARAKLQWAPAQN